MPKIKVVDYDQMNLTWSIDVYYRDQHITTLSRQDFEKLKGMFAISVRVLKQRHNAKCDVIGCNSRYPFEINCHLYNAQKLSSLKALLIKQHDPNLDTLVVATERYENEHELPILKSSASSEEEFEEYMNFLNNDDNVLKLRLKELNVEKRIDLKFIKNINLIYDEYIENMDKENEDFVQASGKLDNSYSRAAQKAREFRSKYDKILSVINNS